MERKLSHTAAFKCHEKLPHIVSAFYKGYVNDREKKNYIATGTNVKSIYGTKRVPSEGVKQLSTIAAWYKFNGARKKAII